MGARRVATSNSVTQNWGSIVRCIRLIALIRSLRQLFIGPRACDVLMSSPCALADFTPGSGALRVHEQVIASPVMHGWFMVWAERNVVVTLVYETGWLRRGRSPHINPHHAPPKHVQAKAGTLSIIAQIPRGLLA